MVSVFEFDTDLSSTWLDAQAHYEALTDYVNELPTLFAHHSTQIQLRKQQSLNNFLKNPSLSKEDKEIADHEFHDSVEIYNHQLRQIIYSPAIIAIVSCFEHYIRTAFDITNKGEKFSGMSTARKKIEKTYPNVKDLYPNDLHCIIEARNIIAHLNGWINFYQFGGKCKSSEHEFRDWASKVKFCINDLDILVAGEPSVKHCFHGMEVFFVELPAIINN